MAISEELPKAMDLVFLILSVRELSSAHFKMMLISSVRVYVDILTREYGRVALYTRVLLTSGDNDAHVEEQQVEQSTGTSAGAPSYNKKTSPFSLVFPPRITLA